MPTLVSNKGMRHGCADIFISRKPLNGPHIIEIRKQQTNTVEKRRNISNIFKIMKLGSLIIPHVYRE